ncbi:hypothetical protein [Thermovibrio sp.]
MRFLITGSLNGKVERLKGLVEVSEPDIVITIGPLGLKSPLELEKSWFFVRGKGDDLEVLRKSSGIDILSRIFRTKEGITFSGLSGVYNPQSAKFIRKEWVKARGKIDKRAQNYLFKEDYDGILIPFKNSPVERLDILVLADSPRKPEIEEVIRETRPRFVFYPEKTYKKEKVRETTFIGLEEVESPKGKYILNL